MGLSKSQRIIILLGIDGAFFLVELIVGYAVHSLALVADAFHMLNDVLSLCVGLWAVRVADRASSQMYTYGWQRAETLGALVNGVFLVALCMSIFLEAIQRFVEPQVVSNPKLVLIVGCLGLASNLLGLLLFHDHSHGGHSHGSDEFKHAEEGHSHVHGISHEADEHTHLVADQGGSIEEVLPTVRVAGADSAGKQGFAKSDEENTTLSGDSQNTRRRSSIGAAMQIKQHRRRTSAFGSIDHHPVHPGSFRQGIVRAAQVDELSEPDSEQAVCDENQNGTTGRDNNNFQGYGSINHSDADHSHDEERAHQKPKEFSGGGHGHSHGDLNMRGVFLHVLGDALGNIGVIVTALIIWLTDWSFKYYFDPGVSLVITAIILTSAIPLCKAASRVLLQAVPVGMSVQEIQDAIEELDGVTQAHHLHVWQLSDTKLVASLHVQVDCEIEGAGSASYMRLARAIRDRLHDFGIHSSTIQPEFLQGAMEVMTGPSGPSGLGENGLKHIYSHLLPHNGTLSKTSSLRDEGCMLECDDGCETQEQCCPPLSTVNTNAGLSTVNTRQDGLLSVRTRQEGENHGSGHSNGTASNNGHGHNHNHNHSHNHSHNHDHANHKHAHKHDHKHDQK